VTLAQCAQDVSVSGATHAYATVGWLAPQQVAADGVMPARLYVAGRPGDVAVGDLVTVDGVGYVATSVGYWHPGDLEVVLSSTVLVDRCRIERRTGQSYDDATNTMTDTWAVVWEGPCDLDSTATVGSRTDARTEAAGDPVTLSRLTASIPATVTDVEPMDTLTVTQSGDARLVGRRFTITAIRMGTTPALRSLLLEGVE